MPQYHVKVKPGSSQEKVLITDPGELTVYLRAKPHDGEANASLISVLAKHFKVGKTSIKIVRSSKSREKIVEID